MTITTEMLSGFCGCLRARERSECTIKKYIRDVERFAEYVNGAELDRSLVLCFKEDIRRDMSAISANSVIAAVNCFFKYAGVPGLCVRAFKVQRRLFSVKDELTEREYRRLVKAATDAHSIRLSLIIQTICSTGIRVSELKFITAEAVAAGHAEVCCKGKSRIVFLPDKLRAVLKNYLRQKKITVGAVFVTRSGKAVDRSNIWREMKSLCEAARVSPEKVFPHNLRHLFARSFYSLEKDISRLSDVLGHSNIATTRIYTMESGYNHCRQINLLNLVVSLS